MTADPLIGLAGPVRHEANNLLAAISGTADLMARGATTERDIARAQRLREAADRLAALLAGYFSLAAPPPDGTAAGTVIEALRPLLVLMLGPGRAVEIAVDPGLPPLAATPAAVQAALLGLAREASEGGAQGLAVTLRAAPGGAMLTVAAVPPGAAPRPIFLAARGA